jgi:hypothetical protein
MRWFQDRGVTADQLDCTKCPHRWPPHQIEITNGPCGPVRGDDWADPRELLAARRDAF